jgi:hypothetical protein
LEPVDPVPLYGCGVVADGRPQKNRGDVNVWPINSEPTTLSPSVINDPLARVGNAICAMPVTASG